MTNNRTVYVYASERQWSQLAASRVQLSLSVPVRYTCMHNNFPRRKYLTLLFCFMFTGAVQSVQVLLQLILFAFGLLSVHQGAPVRCTLHLLGPAGMWNFTVDYFGKLSLFWYFPQTLLPKVKSFFLFVVVLYF